MTIAPERRGDDAERWTAHPKAAWILRLAIRLSPVAAAALLSWQLSIALRGPEAHHRWVVFFGIALASLALAIVVERVARRLLPLTTLLALTMLFPDQAPTRWKVARRAARPHAIDAPDSDLTEASISLLAALTTHDRKTRGHSERVRLFADMLGQELRLSRADADRLRWAALLHDVGKIEVEATLLNKPGLPTPAEWRELRAHPLAGARLAGPLLPWLGEWGEGIVEHHERYDGTGYPRGLGAADISRAGRLLAVVDAFEVMTAARSYKRPMTVAKARLELADSAGSHFDPAMVRSFLAISLPRLLWTTGPLAFLANLPFLAGFGSAARVLPALATPTAAAAGVVAAAGILGAVPAQAAPAAAHRVAAGPSLATLVVGPTPGVDTSAPVVVTGNGDPEAAPTARPATGPRPKPGATAAPTAATTAPTPPAGVRPTSPAPVPTAPAAGAPDPDPAAPVTAPTHPVPVPTHVLPIPLPTLVVPKPAPTHAAPQQDVTFTHVPKASSSPYYDSFTFSSPTATRYAFSLDGGSWSYAVTTPGETVSVFIPYAAPGKHTFRVKVVDAAGVAQGPVASYSWTTVKHGSDDR